MLFLAKYLHCTPVTCHFLIKKNNYKRNYEKKNFKKKNYNFISLKRKKEKKKMGVLSGVISQLRPNLLDTPLVTVRLQRCDDQFYSPVRRVLIHNHQLIDLSRAQTCHALENILHLRENLVILKPRPK
jgi:hypothetical protein